VVTEHVPAGTQVGTVIASDPDNGQTLTYSIVGGNTNNAFAISPSTGLISVIGVICYEANSHYYLTVRVYDNAIPSLWDEKLVSVILTDVNENPVINNDEFTVLSYSENGTYVGTVIAADPDLNQTLSFSITAGNTGNAFSIDATNGMVSVANSGAVNYLINPVFNLTVSVQDNGSPALSSSAAITIIVTPANTAPVIQSQSFSVIENMPQGMIVGQVLANDPDPGQTLTFSITSGNTNGAFQIGANGVLSIANAIAIDFEANPTFLLNVAVTDNGQPQLSSSASILISLIDVNETPEVTGNTIFSVNEHVDPGTPVGTVSANDPDAGQTLTYSIISGNTNNAFLISASSGLMMVNGNICYENCNQYNLIVRVSDNGSPSLWAEEAITILLLDVNESPVVSNQEFNAPAFAPEGRRIGTIAANDPDMNQSLTYTIQSGNTDEAFSVNPLTGEIFVANSNALNPILNPLFSIMVVVTDDGSPALSSSAMVSITVSNQNHAPEMYPQEFKIDENQPEGTIIGTVLASDFNPLQTLTFSIISGNIDNAFSISPTGELSVNNAVAINHEANPEITLLVLVSDNGTPVLWAQAPVTVMILDVNDPPFIPYQKYSVKENTQNKRYVCKVIATDQDPGDTFRFSIIDGNIDNAFSIQASTGRIFVRNSTALNYEVYPLFSLTIRATDNHGDYSEQIIDIAVLDINEAPVVQSETFTINQHAPNGTVVGEVTASDPDRGQILKYSITQGNTNSIFEIGQYTGLISIANSMALKNSTVDSFVLTVRVRDNGTPALSSNGYETITINRNKETGEIIAQTLPERLNLKLKVYPNPSSDGLFNIELEEETQEETTLIITDLTGKKVREEGFSDMMIFKVDLSGLPSGVYLMHAQSGQKHSVSKLIRQ
jgi:hypothetical protein